VSSAGDVLVTGGTGYIGQRLVPALLARGHGVRVFTRQSSMSRVPAGATGVIGDALDAESVGRAMRRGETLVHLVGTPHPSPAKAKEFERVDLASIRAVVAAATSHGLGHLVYVSVAQPGPGMRAYVAVRAAGERLIADAGLTATFIRPWYVLGPGHRWPLALIPLYAVAERIPRWRDGARRLGLVTLSQMVRALVGAVENAPPAGTQRVIDVPGIRAS
jgi:uncharacterized protein YbjT (DUF2867 family)